MSPLLKEAQKRENNIKSSSVGNLFIAIPVTILGSVVMALSCVGFLTGA